jgi:cytochrome c oxidase subunit II
VPSGKAPPWLSGTRHDFAHVQDLYLPIAAAVFAIVVVALVVIVVRFRAREGHAARPTRDRYWLDATLALALAAVVAVLVVVTLRTNDAETALAKPSFHVNALAFQWGWQFTYPSLPGVVDRSRPNRPATLHVPANTTVEVSLRTRDVVHAFWIPDLRFKRDAWPGKVARFDLRFPAGQALAIGHCAQFCGLKHSDMIFLVEGMDRGRFAAWSRSHGGRA